MKYEEIDETPENEEIENEEEVRANLSAAEGSEIMTQIGKVEFQYQLVMKSHQKYSKKYQKLQEDLISHQKKIEKRTKELKNSNEMLEEKIDQRVAELFNNNLKKITKITDEYQNDLKNKYESHLNELKRLREKKKRKTDFKEKLDFINSLITPILFLIIVFFLVYIFYLN